ncbi:ArsR/SmtB family transcription factor [Leifsonia xyli]|uniref:ArsR/SmtB family transcription factor n=1 Tax=Leifsonia xyli TaxID=1575 RepID=UPI003D6644B9
MQGDVFKALADPSRRRLLDSLLTRSGQTLGELCAGLDMARQSVSKHLDVLERANLISTVRRGREKLHYLNAEPINAISERWIRHFDRDRLQALSDLKTALESSIMTDTGQAVTTDFVYTTYIDAPQELVWRALTDPAFTRRYWGMEFDTDWQPGSPLAITHPDRGVTIADAAMVVKEAEPFSRLSYTWQTYTDDFMDAFGYTDEFRAKAAAEPNSTVTYELSRERDLTKLVILHTGFEAGSAVLGDISGGWPLVASWLKSFLESGRYAEAIDA